MTWKEIKDKIESEGVEDEDRILFIDLSSDIHDLSNIKVIKESGTWEITN